MRKFRKEKEPIEMNNEEFGKYLEKSEPVLGNRPERGGNPVMNNGTSVKTETFASQSGTGTGLIRVLRAARVLFPEAVTEDEALNLFMDAFEEEFLKEEDSAQIMNPPISNKGEKTNGRVQQNMKSAEELVNSWLEDEKKMQKIIPQFSLAKAFENEEYKKLVLENGMDIFSAYEKINPIKKAVQTGNIDEVGNSTNATVPGSSSSDISNASDEEFNRYIKRIMDGE